VTDVAAAPPPAVTFVDIEPEDARLVSDVLPVLLELRPHLTPASLAEIARGGHVEGLRFLAAYDGLACVGVAGWRFMTNTSAGRKLYVDDLVTASDRRSAGVGAALLAELEARAVAEGCTVLDLDSGVQRADAHRFYFREHMSIRSFHLSKSLA
jgi:GNAT superfamily N-acetyltransferase